MSGFHPAAAPKCTICTKSVFKMEEVNAIGKIWHKDCFSCGGANGDGCKKHLTLDSYTDHEGQPYCKSCHARLFGPRGFSTNSASIHSYVGDAGIAPVTDSVAVAPTVHGDVHAAVASHEATHGIPAHATGPQCTICHRSVYKMEEVVAIGKTWHKDCFLCGGANSDGCRKHLTLDGYTDHESQPYCKVCHGRLFGPRGYNNSAGTHSYVGDAGVAEAVAAVSIHDHVEGETHLHAGAVHAAVASHNTKTFGAAAPKCTVCEKSVYKMEEVVAIGKTWHKDCFLCGGMNANGCKKHLTLDSYSDHEGQPYCKVCHGRLFGPRGYNNSAGTHSYVDDHGVPQGHADA